MGAAASAPTITAGQSTNGQYSATAEYKRPGSIMEVRKPMALVYLAYMLDPAKVTQFQEFYKTKIHAWMKKRGVRHAHAYVTGTTFVVLASIEADVPWIDGYEQRRLGVEPIDGFEGYLAKEQPEIIKLPVFSAPKHRQR